MNNNDKNFTTLGGAIAQTLIDKNRAYGDSYDESIDTWGKKAMGMRLEDKYNRIKWLLLHDKATENNESLFDTLLDNAGYSLLAINYMIKHEMVSNKDLERINQNSKVLFSNVFDQMSADKEKDKQEQLRQQQVK